MGCKTHSYMKYIEQRLKSMSDGTYLDRVPARLWGRPGVEDVQEVLPNSAPHKNVPKWFVGVFIPRTIHYEQLDQKDTHSTGQGREEGPVQ